MIAAMMLLLPQSLFSQKSYTFESIPGDPLNTRIYTLSNELKVYLTVNKETPRIQTAVAIRTGSKNDPADNTGLSHYLEHMMFKGTKHFGTTDYEREAPLLEKIEQLFEEYRGTKDSIRRKEIYQEIDKVSAQAASFAIANEYDKLLTVIGAKGTNAFTGNEQTVYINDIPSNQIENWLRIESDRFANPVFRIFHTELETVYEEKNMSLDRDGDKVWESLYSGLYQVHPYGTQTTIGTVEHLKNPSLKRLRQYYQERYAPNNMAIIMAGDFNPDSVIKQIDEYFGVLSSREVKHFVSPEEQPIMKPVIKTVMGPDAESIVIGFRCGGLHSEDANLLDLVSEILSNGQAGLMDLNLNLAQKVISASAGADIQTDYSALILRARPKTGQTLDEVQALLLSQLELVKKGEFPDWLLSAIVNNRLLSKIRQQENNMSRAMDLANVFVTEMPYADYVNEVEILSRLTKADVVEFANRVFGDNYVVVKKLTGVDPSVMKVTKPAITPVVMQRDVESAFFTDLVARPVAGVEPVFVNYKSDMKKFKTPKKGLDVLYIPNRTNNLFNLYYYFSMGSQNDLKLALAANYLSYLGTSRYTAEQLKQEFYKIGCSYSVSVSNDEIYVNLSGLSNNMIQAIQLLEELLSDAQPNTEALSNLVNDILKNRTDNKLNKNVIRQALSMYGTYGPRSPFTNILGENQLRSISADELVLLIKSLSGYYHEVFYYGPVGINEATGRVPDPRKGDDLGTILDKYHNVPAVFRKVPERVKYVQLPTNMNKVFVVDYSMKQVDIVLHSLSASFDAKEVPVTRMFNEYFGAGMNSIVFQEIREAKALAYSSSAAYRNPSYPDEKNTIFAFVGTQNDKMPEALKAMFALFNDMPESEKSFIAAQEGILNQIRTERITKTRVFFNYINARKFGYEQDIRKQVYETVPGLTFKDILKFQETYLKDKNFTILVVGDTKKMDIELLKSYGEVQFLKLQDIFGY